MIRVVVAADSGHVFASLTAAVAGVSGAFIARYGSSAGRLDRIVAPLAPDLVLIGSAGPQEALARLAEVRHAAPAARVVVVSSTPEVGWLADALRAHATAVLPGDLEPRVTALVLAEVMADEGAAAAPADAGATGRAQAVPLRPRRRRRARTHPAEHAREGQAA